MRGLSRQAPGSSGLQSGETSKPKSYVICTTARSGSNLLCDYLDQTGVLGRPAEFLNPEVVINGAYDRRFGKGPDLPVGEYIDWLYGNMSTDNNIFGIKILYEDFVAYRGFIRFQELLHDSALFYLDRKSKINQAISYYVARNTGRWMASDPGRTANDLHYDYKAIDDSLEMLVHQHIEWQAFLSSIERPVEMIEYDQVVNNPLGVIGQIGAALGIDVTGVALAQNVPAQRTGASDHLLARYKEDLRAFYYGLTAEIPYEGLLLKP